MPAKRLLRLLMISGDFPPRRSGVGDYAFHISQALAKRGTQVTVLTDVAGDQTEIVPNAEAINTIRGIVGWRLGEFSQVLEAFDRLGPDTVVNIQYNCLAYGRSLLVTLLPMLFRIARPQARVVVTIHGFWEQSRLFKLRALPMLRAAHRVIYVDRQNEKLLKTYCGKDTAHLGYIPIAGNIPPIGCTPAERSSWRTAFGFSDNDIVVAFFGGLGRSKGVDYLLQAIATMRANRGLAIRFLLIGGFAEGSVNKLYNAEFRSLIAKLEAASWITLCDFPPPSEVSKALHSADFAVFPFLRGVGENSGSMLAALAHGLPTIVTSGQANAESMEELFGVMRVPANDVVVLVRGLTRLIEDPSLRDAMRKRGLHYVRTHDWDEIGKATEQFMESLDPN